MVYADDICLLASSPQQLQALIDALAAYYATVLLKSKQKFLVCQAVLKCIKFIAELADLHQKYSKIVFRVFILKCLFQYSGGVRPYTASVISPVQFLMQVCSRNDKAHNSNAQTHTRQTVCVTIFVRLHRRRKQSQR